MHERNNKKETDVRVLTFGCKLKVFHLLLYHILLQWQSKKVYKPINMRKDKNFLQVPSSCVFGTN